MNNLRHQGFYYGALLYALLIPFPHILINIALIVWVVFSLFSYSRATLVKEKYLWLLPGFYVLYFMGIFTSETLSLKFLEYKLSLIIFPLLFFLHAYDQKQRDGILKVFVGGLVASALVCLIMAFYNSFVIHNGDFAFRPNVLEDKGFIESILYGGNYFFGRYLSIFHQTVYYALYLCTGAAIVLFRPRLFTIRLRVFLIVFFTAIIFLVSNKASFIALILIIVIWLLTIRGSSTKRLSGVIVFALILGIFIFLNPRIKESTMKLAHGEFTLNQDARYGFDTRLLSWDAAISLIKARPFLGYGHGETQAVLNKAYEEKGYIFPLRESYNAHNLWLQSWLENGILAVMVLIFIFYFLFKRQIPKFGREPLLFVLVLMLLVNSMFEGMFNRFSGISFFSFLVCFIFSAAKGGRTEE